MTNSIQTLVDRYLDAWNLTEGRARRARIDEVFVSACSYTDPMASVSGREGVDGFIAAVQQQFPGARFVRHGAVDAHHDVARFSWHALVEGVMEPVAVGFDVVVLEAERIRQVVGFLDKAPG